MSTYASHCSLLGVIGLFKPLLQKKLIEASLPNYQHFQLLEKHYQY
ncbi:hypothetical protein OD547_002240 [Salmonella enterica]|nr:hypothetical protein [Salmonella enterica]